MNKFFVLLIGLFLITTNFISAQPFTEASGKAYKTVKIGKQIWMAENLNYKTSIGSWCYDNTIDNCAKYGRLYNWETALEVCPNGWHLPGDAEWTVLTDYLDNKYGKLKATKGWNAPNTGATNSTGFGAIPGGGCNSNVEIFSGIGESGNWWTSTGSDDKDAFFRTLSYNYENADTHKEKKEMGYSVRCLKN